MTDTESTWASPGSPHCPTSQMHPHTPRSLPQSALSWMHPQQRLCPHPAPRPQVRAGGPPHPESWGGQAGTDTQTDPPNLGVSKAVAPLESCPSSTSSSSWGWSSLLHLTGMGNSRQQRGVVPPPALSPSLCAGLCVCSWESRSGSGAAVVVSLCGCQAMVSLNAEAEEQWGRMLMRGTKALPALRWLLLTGQSCRVLHPGTEKQVGRGGPRLLSRQGSTVSKTSQKEALVKPETWSCSLVVADPFHSTEVLVRHHHGEAVTKSTAQGMWV